MTKKKSTLQNTKTVINKTQQIVEQKTTVVATNNSITNTNVGTNKFSKWIALALVVAVAFGVFINSRNNQFVLDDHGIIKSNKITKRGITKENIKTIFTTALRKGDVTDNENSLYRPMAKLLFAAEWQWGNGQPEYFHLWNIIYFVLCCVLLYWLLYLATKGNWLLAFAICALFAVHPIHSEVVANVKSLDEIIGAIGVLGALICFHYFIKSNNYLLLVVALISYIFGIFGKESAIVAIGLVPVYLYYFTNASIKQMILPTVVMLIGAAIFIAMRHNAIGALMNYSGKDPSALDNVLALTKLDASKDGGYQMKLFIPTCIYLMGYYVYTLFYPFPLSCDYSYATVNVVGFTGEGAWKFWVSLLFFAAIIYFAIKTFKQKNIIGFGIAWFLIASSIVSNLFIVIGTSFGERLMFLPSIGFCIAVVSALYYLLKYSASVDIQMNILKGIKTHIPLFIILLVVGIIYGNKTMSRNLDWKTDDNLFRNDVQNFDNSTHLLFYWGNHISSSEYQELLRSQGKSTEEQKQANYEAINTFKKAMSIYPALPSDGYNQYGKAYYNIGNIDSAELYYKKAHLEDTTNSVFLNNIGTVFFQRAIPLKRIDYYDSAYYYFKKAYLKDTTMIDYMNNLGAISGTLQKLPKAIKWFYNGYLSDSLSEGAVLSCNSLAVTYKNLGDSVQMNYWVKKGQSVQQYRMNKLQNGGF